MESSFENKSAPVARIVWLLGNKEAPGYSPPNESAAITSLWWVNQPDLDQIADRDTTAFRDNIALLIPEYQLFYHIGDEYLSSRVAFDQSQEFWTELLGNFLALSCEALSLFFQSLLCCCFCSRWRDKRNSSSKYK